MNTARFAGSLLVLVAYAMSVPTTKDQDINVYLVRTKRYQHQDQRVASSGYSYETQGPTSYVQFASYSPAGVTHQEVQQVHHPYPHPHPHPQPHPAVKAPEEPVVYVEDDKEYKEEAEEAPVAEYEEEEEGAAVVEGEDNDDGDSDSYEEGHGASYDEANKSKHGASGSKGYASKESFAKGASGKHSSEDEAASHAESGGSKTSGHEDEGHYDEAHASGKSEEGGSHADSASHKKGSITKGYHKVYRKDEYKKEHKFYDEQDVKGHHDSYGSGHKAHSSAAGGFRDGGHHASGHHAGQFAKKGGYDKGKYDKHDAGYKAKDGGEKYYKNYQDYDAAQGKHSYQEGGY